MLTTIKRLLFEDFPVWDDPSQCVFHRVEIDTERCDGCKLCVVVCPARVLELVGEKGKKKARTRSSVRGCISCNNCQAICDNDAIHATQHFGMTGYYESQGIGAFSPPRTSF